MKTTFNNLKRAYSYGKEYKWNIILQAVACILIIIINIVLPIMSAKQIVYITDNLFTQLFVVSLVILGINIIGSLKTVLIRKNTQAFHKGFIEKVQKLMGNEILKISQSDLDKNSTGTFIERMISDVNEISCMFTTGMGNLTGILSSIGVFASVFFINRYCFMFYLITSTILTLLCLIKASKYNIKDKQKRLQQEKVSGMIGELIRGARDIKMLNARDSYMDELNYNIALGNDKNIEMRNVEMKYVCIIGLLTSLFEFILVMLLVYLISISMINIPIALALFSYRTKIMGNFMQSVSLLFDEINRFNISCERVFSILDNTEFKKEQFGTKHIDKVEGNFEFKNVVFGYDESNKILNNLSFKINSNSTIGFVGKSGAGKTTIFSLLCKMYDIQGGSIKIDGVDINELDEETIRGNITIIGQSPYIFNMSIKDNLRLVKYDITDEEVKEACEIACLTEFIESLPNKYDTLVGEGGVTLSGGQRQRLAIARAFVQKTKIILFDEATSALDNETQSKIQKAIDNLKEDYTILIIAHRLSTIINCDSIMLLEDGMIKDQGTHSELLEKNSTYKKLCKTEVIK